MSNRRIIMGKGAIAPRAIWFLEVSNALIVGERCKRLTSEESDEAQGLLSKLPLNVYDRSGFALVAELLTLARQYNLSAYYAAYLALAQRIGFPLATLDRKLQHAAETPGIVRAVG